MPESHLKFHSANGKRRILVIEDEFINREILGYMLRDSYDLVFAETGAKALELLEEGAFDKIIFVSLVKQFRNFVEN